MELSFLFLSFTHSYLHSPFTPFTYFTNINTTIQFFPSHNISQNHDDPTTTTSSRDDEDTTDATTSKPWMTIPGTTTAGPNHCQTATTSAMTATTTYPTSGDDPQPRLLDDDDLDDDGLDNSQSNQQPHQPKTNSISLNRSLFYIDILIDNKQIFITITTSKHLKLTHYY